MYIYKKSLKWTILKESKKNCSKGKISIFKTKKLKKVFNGFPRKKSKKNCFRTF